MLTHMHTGEECELTCRESNNDVVILPSNMTVESVLKEHWRNPHKVKVSLYGCLYPPRSSDRRTSQSSVIHNSPVRNFTHSVNILALLPTMQNACLSFAHNAVQMFVFEARQPFKHFCSVFDCKCENMVLPLHIPAPPFLLREIKSCKASVGIMCCPHSEKLQFVGFNFKYLS